MNDIFTIYTKRFITDDTYRQWNQADSTDGVKYYMHAAMPMH